MLKTEEPVLRQDNGPISYLRLNRPSDGNSLSLATIIALQSELNELVDDTSITVIVLDGVGSRIFCAGHDLKEFNQTADSEFFHQISTRCSAMMQSFQRQPQIIIAAVDGIASAAGCQLVANADLAVASSKAQFATPGVNIGLWCLTPMVALSRAVHRKHAMQMLSTGRRFDAEFALRIGLVNEVVPPEQLMKAVDKLACEIASKSNYTLALGKRAFYQQLQMSMSDAYEYAGELVTRNMTHQDAKEGITAFVEKRAPVWIGR